MGIILTDADPTPKPCVQTVDWFVREGLRIMNEKLTDLRPVLLYGPDGQLLNPSWTAGLQYGDTITIRSPRWIRARE